MPPELHSTAIAEAGTGTWHGSENQSQRRGADGSNTPMNSFTAVKSTPDPPPLQPQSSDPASALAEEADILVQEMGLVRMRKKALTTEATAQGLQPENREGRKGSEYHELLSREQRLRERLDEIEREREDIHDT